MTTRSCSQGHVNQASDRFCPQCGEALPTVSAQLGPNDMIHDRYRMLHELGQGGFGHTYLVEDTHRFHERCVVKMFAPAVATPGAMAKARELFEREAGVLYRLQHPQIPRFREWFIDPMRQSLYIVQDYVDGPTFLTLLRDRIDQGLTFTEFEVVQFLNQVLPVLEYIHREGMIHRDISPDNLILRRQDHLPVLIDFGGVKQIGVAIESTDPKHKRAAPTVLGKPGYAPEEQIRLGRVSPSSDLYALAVTALVLMVGKEPQAFYDANHRTYNWRQYVQIRPALATIFETMLATDPDQRYPSATAVREALDQAMASQVHSTQRTLIKVAAQSSSVLKTLIASTRKSVKFLAKLAAKPQKSHQQPKHPAKFRPKQYAKSLVKLASMALIMTAVASAGWWGLYSWLTARSSSNPIAETPAPSGLSEAEQQRKVALFDRLDQLGISDALFYSLVNEAYYTQYPEHQGRILTNSPEDDLLRAHWDQIADQVLDAVAAVDPANRDRIGSYSGRDRSRWNQQLQPLNLRLTDLTPAVDRQLNQYLPMYQGGVPQSSQVEQIWYGLLATAVEQRLNQ